MVSAPGGVRIQRLLKTTAKELKPKDFNPLKTAKKLLGGGTKYTEAFYDSIYESLKAYEKADKNETRQVLQILHGLDGDIRQFLDVKPAGKQPAGYARQKAQVLKLLDEVNDELKTLGQRAGQEVYGANVMASQRPPDRNSDDPGSRFALQSLTKGAFDDAGRPASRKAEALVEKYGITDQELMAIRIFTSNDYGYINPAIAVDQRWMDRNKNSKTSLAAASFQRNASNEINMSEGQLQGAVMLSGVRKLPAYEGTIYRGTWLTEKDWKKIKQGRFDLPSFASTSLDREIAHHWIARDEREDPTQKRVLLVIANSGGRDIAALSSNGHEKEVVLLPGTSYKLQSIDEKPGHDDVHTVTLTG